MSRKFLHFSSIFTNEEVNKCFYNHLVEERNTESLNFIMEVENYKNEKTIEKIKKIYEKFILEESKEEINVSSSEKRELLKVYKSLKMKKKKILLKLKKFWKPQRKF
jgi:hypothetical protein